MNPPEPASRPPTNATPAVHVSDQTGRLSLADAAWLHAHVDRALGLLGVGGEVRLKVVDDREMAHAHETYSGVAGTTDVLTFDLTDGEGTSPLDVDILLCLDEASRQARARGHEPRRELLLYSIHGILHCLGHDDHDPEAYELMHAQEDKLLTALGVGATFAREDHARATEPTP